MGRRRGGAPWGIQFPTHDPLTLIPRLSGVASKLGFEATKSGTLCPPSMLARKLAALDHITKGRIGIAD